MQNLIVKKKLFLIGIVTALLYLFGSLVCWDMWPGSWNSILRFIVGLVWLVVSFVVVMILTSDDVEELWGDVFGLNSDEPN